jgi:hypothetical protein
MMTKEEYLALTESRYEELAKLNEQKDFYTYEETFEKIWMDLAREVLERNISSLGSDRRKKTRSGPDSDQSK